MVVMQYDGRQNLARNPYGDANTNLEFALEALRRLDL